MESFFSGYGSPCLCVTSPRLQELLTDWVDFGVSVFFQNCVAGLGVKVGRCGYCENVRNIAILYNVRARNLVFVLMWRLVFLVFLGFLCVGGGRSLTVMLIVHLCVRLLVMALFWRLNSVLALCALVVNPVHLVNICCGSVPTRARILWEPVNGGELWCVSYGQGNCLWAWCNLVQVPSRFGSICSCGQGLRLVSFGARFSIGRYCG